MLASNFRFGTEDVDISKLEQPWPEWLRAVVDELAARNGWSDGLVQRRRGISPERAGGSGARSSWSSARSRAERARRPDRSSCRPPAIMLALKLKALRVSDPHTRRQESADILNLLRVARYSRRSSRDRNSGASSFPTAARMPTSSAFVLKHILSEGAVAMRPTTLAEAIERIVAGDAAGEGAAGIPRHASISRRRGARSSPRLPSARARPATVGSMRLSARWPNIWRGSIGCRRIPDWVFEP